MRRLGWRRPRWVLVLAALTTFVLPPLQAEAQKSASPETGAPVTSLFSVRIGGYVQTNVTWDSDENNDDNPSSLRKISVVKGTPQEHRETLRWAATRTRLFIDVRGPDVWGAKSRAYTEFDWDGLKLNENTGASSASSAQTPRLRHAYARFDWPMVYLVAGQTTLIFDSVVSSQSELEGVSSGHGDITAGSRNRTPQFILGTVIPIGPAKLEVAGSVGRHQTDRTPAAGLNDSGSRGALPALQGLVKGSVPLFGRDAILAGSYYWGEDTLTVAGTSVGGSRAFRDVHSTGFAVEAFVPLPAIAGIVTPDLRGSWFTADAMDRWNLGLNGLTSTDPTRDPHQITATGFWVEANLQLLKDFNVGAGYGNVADARTWVLTIVQSTPAPVAQNNAGLWIFGQWNVGPVLVELLYGRVDTTFIAPSGPSARREEDTRSTAYHLIFRYRF